MGGALIQLICKGAENIYLSVDPQITFFNMVYRRHTNFSREHKILNFIQVPNFGTKVSCNIPQLGDLLSTVYLTVTLPAVSQQADNSNTVTYDGTTIYSENKFAWARNIGYVIIKTVEVVLNGRNIDTQYGEWLYIWNQLTEPKSEQYDKMIGNVPELYNFTNGKNEYILYIPLQFWFCKKSGLALPLVSLQLSDIKINIEFNNIEKCYIKAPSLYIQCISDLVAFKKYEILKQTYDGDDIFGLYDSYDIVTKRLYYTSLSQKKFIGIIYNTTTTLDQSNIDMILSSPQAYKYSITGIESKFYVIPYINATSKSNPFININLSLGNTYLLADYIYLDDDEREKFAKNKHVYLIEQIYFTPSNKIDSINAKIKLSVNQPTKLLCWVVQLNSIANSLDYFNYTNSPARKIINYGSYTELSDPSGISLIKTQTIQLNGLPIFPERSKDYFNYCLPYQYFKYGIAEGINICPFSLHPQDLQPSGTCNMSKIDNINIILNLQDNVNVRNNAYCRCYAIAYNILKISSGLAGLVFTS